MTHAARIAAAQHAVMIATVVRDILNDEVHAAVNDPDPAFTVAMFNAWNDRLEDEMERSGYNAAVAELSKARDDLFAAGAAWVREVAPESIVIELLARAEASHLVARNRLIDLWMRLDTRTVKV